MLLVVKADNPFIQFHLNCTHRYKVVFFYYCKYSIKRLVFFLCKTVPKIRLFRLRKGNAQPIAELLLNPIALKMAKTLWSFGCSECNKVNKMTTRAPGKRGIEDDLKLNFLNSK